MKLAIVSLGCPKNQVDADRYSHALLAAGHETVPDMREADVIVINTCGFIQSAKEEAIEQIFDACAIKKENPNLRVIVTGCLAQRYSEDLAREIPELDAVVGIGKNGELPKILNRISSGIRGGAFTGATQGVPQNASQSVPGSPAGASAKKKGPAVYMAAKTDLPLEGARIISTPQHYAWLKIAEGCSNACSYCAIPAIRGPLRSRPMDAVLAEARWLVQQGVRELVLVAQDVTAYGDDRRENQIVPLLRALNEVEGLHWIRLLYAYPERITETLLETMRACNKVLPYLDLPIQHCNDEILRSMRRRGGAAAVRQAIERIRAKLPGAVLRTTLITGYPGETEAQFEELCSFVTQTRFDRLGCFAYSPEDGTPAAELPGQLPDEVRQARAETVMRLQGEVMAAKQQALVGKTLEVVCDSFDEDSGLLLCRGAADAPEIDANVLVQSAVPLREGSFANVCVTAADGYDLYASASNGCNTAEEQPMRAEQMGETP